MRLPKANWMAAARHEVNFYGEGVLDGEGGYECGRD
jgi:hypothetical protein